MSEEPVLEEGVERNGGSNLRRNNPTYTHQSIAEQQRKNDELRRIGDRGGPPRQRASTAATVVSTSGVELSAYYTNGGLPVTASSTIGTLVNEDVMNSSSSHHHKLELEKVSGIGVNVVGSH